MANVKIYKNFAFDQNDYTFGELAKMLDGAGKHTEKEYRAEYSRLYKVAKSRLARFESAGLTKNHTYKRAVRAIKPQSSLKTDDFVKAFTELHRFLTSPTGTITGAKESDARAIAEFRADGLEWVNSDNLYDFYEFLDKIAEAGYDLIYGSERLVEVFEDALESGMASNEIFQAFDKFMSQKKDRTGKKEDLNAFRQNIWG